MSMRLGPGCCVVVLLSAVTAGAAGSELADAAMTRNRDAVRSLLQRKSDVNAPRRRVVSARLSPTALVSGVRPGRGAADCTETLARDATVPAASAQPINGVADRPNFM
jgi:hypothetical protein